MREIKFRAWDTRLKRMFVPDYLGLNDGKCFADTQRSPLDFEVMQYTGLKDRDGIEIYEGDILEPKCNGIRPFVVKFDNGAFNASKFKVGDCVVTGNQFENPELLTD